MKKVARIEFILTLFVIILIWAAETKSSWHENSKEDYFISGKKQRDSDKLAKKNRDCIPLGFDQLMSQYKSWTGYNSLYVAATTQDAVLFPNLLWDTKTKRDYLFILDQLRDLYKQVLNSSDPNSALIFKNMIESHLNASLSKNTGVSFRSRKRGIFQRTIITSYCTKTDEQDPSTKLFNMCQQCAATTTHSSNR